MNVAGPSQPRFGRPGANGRAPNASEYEEELLQLILDLGPLGAQHLRQYYENRSLTGQRMTDHEMAMSLFLQNAEDITAVDQDRELARLLAEELDLGEDDDMPRHRPTITQPQNTQATTPNRATGHGPSNPEGTQTWGEWFASMFGWLSAPPPSATPLIKQCIGTQGPAVTPPVARATGHVCVICQDPIYGSEVRAPCSHYYDVACLTDLFESATRDESLYPPRCCRQNITLAQAQAHLSRDLISRFEEKAREFGTLDRVYCVQPTCSHFLGPVSQGTLFGGGPPVYNCSAPRCTARTCAGCRGRYDGWTHICRQDQGAEHVLNLGQNEGWARCPGCAQMIELNVGCFHMTCRCRTEFCYLCRARWKTCACPQWDERRLVAAAEQRVDARLAVQQRLERRRPVPPAQPAWLARPAQPAPVVPVVQPRARPVPPRPAPQPRTPTLPPIVRLRQLAQNTAQPAPGPSRPAAVPAWLAEARARSLGAAAAPPPPPAVRAQPQAQHQTALATNPHVVRPPQLPTTTRAGVSGTRPAPPTVPPKPAALTGLARASAAPTQAGSFTSKTQTQAQASPRTSAAAPTPTIPRATGAIKSIVSNLNERERNNQQGGTQGGSGSGPDSASWRRRIGTQNDAVRQGMIREMMERLRVDHECDHANWRYRHGGGRCEGCHHDLPLYLFRCQGCEMLVCNRCRRNRL